MSTSLATKLGKHSLMRPCSDFFSLIKRLKDKDKLAAELMEYNQVRPVEINGLKVRHWNHEFNSLDNKFKTEPLYSRILSNPLVPTYSLADTVFVEPYREILDRNGISYTYNIAAHRFKTQYGNIKIY